MTQNSYSTPTFTQTFTHYPVIYRHRQKPDGMHHRLEKKNSTRSLIRSGLKGNNKNAKRNPRKSH